MQHQEAFVRLIKENEGIIYKITRAYARDREDQKDLYQEVVYQLWKSFESFKGNSKWSTWTYRVALNTSLTYANRRKNKGHSVPFDLEALNRLDEPDSVMEERVAILYAHIKELNVIEKGLILLFLEGKSYEEIAEITGFTVTNVGTRLGRIKQKLKTKIKK